MYRKMLNENEKIQIYCQISVALCNQNCGKFHINLIDLPQTVNNNFSNAIFKLKQVNFFFMFLLNFY